MRDAQHPFTVEKPLLSSRSPAHSSLIVTQQSPKEQEVGQVPSVFHRRDEDEDEDGNGDRRQTQVTG